MADLLWFCLRNIFPAVGVSTRHDVLAPAPEPMNVYCDW